MPKDFNKVPNMPTVEAFMEATTIRAGGSIGFTKLGPVLARGRLSEVDNSLASWWAIPINRYDEKLRHTLVLMRACVDWAGKHKTSKGETRAGAQRMIGVENVMKQCKNWLATLHTTASQLKSLDSHYAGERQDYKASKTVGIRANPVGGTYVSEIKGRFAKNEVHSGIQSLAAILAKPMNQMNDQDFRAISMAMLGEDRALGATVKYMSSTDRESFLLIVQNSVICKADGSPVNTDLAYAMDKYGTIYGARTNHGFNDATFLNHSSFLSGKDVICAGTIETTSYFDSVLREDFDKNPAALKPELMRMPIVTTLSGHYKPTQQHLKNCLLSLEASGLDLDRHAAYHNDMNGTLIFLRASEFVRRY